MAVERMRNCANICALADGLGVHRTVLYHWYRQVRQQATDATATSPVRELRKQVLRLSKLLADETLEVDFFKGALQRS
jgi:transposase-like protein